ncbi:hypothetical protein [Thiosocius teredinicola]|uniref:hypothetical protein n=1 Tax=Thiosocius teredinicola TaxID=1973002 RepID=UPI000F79342F
MRLAIFAVFSFLTGCAPVVRDYYLPVEAAVRKEDYYCGWVPYGGYSKEVSSGARITLYLAPEKTRLNVGIGLVLSGPPFATLEGDTILLEVYDSSGAEKRSKQLKLGEPQ